MAISYLEIQTRISGQFSVNLYPFELLKPVTSALFILLQNMIFREFNLKLADFKDIALSRDMITIVSFLLATHLKLIDWQLEILCLNATNNFPQNKLG